TKTRMPPCPLQHSCSSMILSALLIPGLQSPLPTTASNLPNNEDLAQKPRQVELNGVEAEEKEHRPRPYEKSFVFQGWRDPVRVRDQANRCTRARQFRQLVLWLVGPHEGPILALARIPLGLVGRHHQPGTEDGTRVAVLDNMLDAVTPYQCYARHP